MIATGTRSKNWVGLKIDETRKVYELVFKSRPIKLYLLLALIRLLE